MTPLILPIGDQGLLVRFGDTLTDEANLAAIALAGAIEAAYLPGVAEVVPNLISVLLRYDLKVIDFERLAGEVRLLIAPSQCRDGARGSEHLVPVQFDGEDMDELSQSLGLSRGDFIAAHNARPLRVLATGFAPGFVYCGMHGEGLVVPRRAVVRRQVPAGTVLFAAGQTAITSTPIPTGWHVIGYTAFRNFDASADVPTTVAAGDRIRFEAA